ncbi:MAG: transcriptional regulator, partial [Actinomycetota bacterium]|nr:transcriptional regulator [Actinomycetota bacterium]
AKYYAPTDVELDLSIPQRGYALVGALLVDALEAAADGAPAREAALRIASQRGREIGGATPRSHAPRSIDEGPAALTDLLEDLGYEPYGGPEGGLALRNCPFHALAQRSPELICALNHAFLDGVLDGLGQDELEAVLACSQPGDCCVLFNPQSA